MKKLSNTEDELKKCASYKKQRVYEMKGENNKLISGNIQITKQIVKHN